MRTCPSPSPRKRETTTYWTSFGRATRRSRPSSGSAGSIASMERATRENRSATRGMNSPVRSLAPAAGPLPFIASPLAPAPPRIPSSLPAPGPGPGPGLPGERAWYFARAPRGRFRAAGSTLPAKRGGRRPTRRCATPAFGRSAGAAAGCRGTAQDGGGGVPAAALLPARDSRVLRASAAQRAVCRARSMVSPRATTDRTSIAANAWVYEPCTSNVHAPANAPIPPAA